MLRDIAGKLDRGITRVMEGASRSLEIPLASMSDTAILLGIFLLGSVSAAPTPARGNWHSQFFTIARALAGAWLIAFGAKGSPVR